MPNQIITMLEEGRLIRREWTDTDEQGRERACLLAAIAPECGQAKTPAVCPATIMPSWLAYFTPWFDDAGTEEAWPRMVRRFANIMNDLHLLDPETLLRLDYTSRRIAAEHAISFAGQSTAVFQNILNLLIQAENGENIPKDTWAGARAAMEADGPWPGAAAAAAWAVTWTAAAVATTTAKAEADTITSKIFDAIEAAIAKAKVKL